MRVPLFISKRYLFSKKSHNAINIITAIAVSGIAVGSMALIIVLSGFNGLERLVEGMYSSFDPEIRVSPAQGKTFELDSVRLLQLEEMAELNEVAFVLEETGLLKYKDKQVFGRIKGVSENFIEMSGLDSALYDGQMNLKSEGYPMAILGYGIADKLGIFVQHVFEPLVVFAAKRTAKIRVNPDEAFRSSAIGISSIFTINPEFDYKYAIVPLDFAQEIFDHKGSISALEISTVGNSNLDEVKKRVQEVIGTDFIVETRYEINEIIYKTNKSEKWITYLILTFILIIATFNVIGSLTILILDKRGDINVLRSMGADKKLIRRIFLSEGFLISALGGAIGLTIGFTLTLLQQEVGLIRLGVASVTEFYPVALELGDFLAVMATVLVLGFIAAYLPVRFVLRKL